MQTSMLSLNEFAEKHPCVGMFDIPSGTLASYLSSLGSLDTIDGSDENKTAISSTNNQGLTCCACGLTFPSREEQGNHFRSDKHRIRLKIMLGWEGGTGKNLEMVKENEDGNCGGALVRPLYLLRHMRKRDLVIYYYTNALSICKVMNKNRTQVVMMMRSQRLVEV